MALLHDSRFVAQDALGNPYSGAKLTVYVANTTTLASVYTTSALSTPLTNPVTADSNGIFPQIFAPEGFTYDLLLKTSGGVTLKTWDDVPALGPDPGTLLRDFGLGGRFQVTGAAGVVTMAVGSASPDNTGGDAIIEGWASSPLDTLKLRAGITTVSSKLRTEGQTYLNLEDALKVENGLEYEGIVTTPTTSFSAVSTLDIALPAGYDVVELDLIDWNCTGTYSQLRTSHDGGSTFKATSGDYAVNYMKITQSGIFNSAGTGATDYFVMGDFTGSANFRADIKVQIFTSSVTNRATQIVVNGFGVDAFNAPLSSRVNGYTKNTYGRVTHVRLFGTGGTITGRYRIVGRKGW